MGEELEIFPKNIKKLKNMKLFGLVAAATASPLQWAANTWWNEALNVYDFAANNPGAFSAADIANYVGMSQESQNFVYNFASKYWNVVDTDANGALDFEEYKLAIGAFAATNARVVIDAYDNNNDGQLSGNELTAWKNQAETAFSNWDWSVDGQTYAALQAAYANAQTDGDWNTCSMIEIARFQLNAGNVFLQ